MARALVQIHDGATVSRVCLVDWMIVCSRSQSGSPDFRHCGRGPAQLAGQELSLLDFLRQLHPTDNHHRSSETLQAQHGAEPLLHASMVLFDGVVQILAAAGCVANSNSLAHFDVG